jgi:glutamate 5-kinase
MIARLIAEARKIVLKFGSNTLADGEGKINPLFLEEFAGQIADLIKRGKQIVIVSSGAQAAGLSTMGRWARKKDIHYRQALCAVGQVELMGAWRRAFEKSGLHIAQILLTQDDFGDPIRTLNMRNTLFTLVDEGIIPVINENDTVSVEEIKIGDNDTLAAQSAILWSADLLILFSDIDGLYTKNPKEFPDAELVEEVCNIGETKKKVLIGSPNSFGTGCIGTKISAAERALPYGISTVIANGSRPRALEALAAGKQPGTAIVVERIG